MTSDILARELPASAGCLMMTASRMRCALVLALCLFATGASARNTIGYKAGTKVKIKVVEVGGAEAEVHTATAFRAMAKAARKDGVDLRIRSGFRSFAKQTALYKKYRRGEGNLAARPGYSNHESGRALDIYIVDYDAYEWLEHHAAKYGFHRTVPGEPWHWEYLGGYAPEREHDRKRVAHHRHAAKDEPSVAVAAPAEKAAPAAPAVSEQPAAAEQGEPGPAPADPAVSAVH